jgi:DNA (cytosine-5)-methyltransferase 1
MRTVVDLFAGCGGMSLGLEMSGFKTVYVNELHPDAMSTYLSNRRNSALENPNNHSYDITKISRSKEKRTKLAKGLRRNYGDIDLLAGGPPCQGFSEIGHRRSFSVDKQDIPTNHLYIDMARMIEAIGPKVFIFENVRGLLNSKWTKNGNKGEIWEDVLRTFARIRTVQSKSALKYKIEWELLYSKNYGVPQNRPRIILIGIREDVYKKNIGTIEKFGFFPKPTTSKAPDPCEVLGDLVDPNWQTQHESNKYIKEAKSDIQKYFRRRNGVVAGVGQSLTDQEYTRHTPEIIEKFQSMLKNDGKVPAKFKTKKFAQRLLPKRWGDAGPNITVASLPDDFVHYSQPRILTVREWARLQTFPDWYQFSGKRTTGGQRRAGNPNQDNWQRELPKYTQIGNAVPVLLAKAIGLHLQKILIN